ncbi:MAG: type II toxin-antitoxin system HicA family toxin [Armatimonadota bacterium]
MSADELAHALRALGYSITRQTGSHMRLTCTEPGEHHVTIPHHNPLRVGTLASILTEVASYHKLGRDELVRLIEGKKR